jgi:hypothetical protein
MKYANEIRHSLEELFPEGCPSLEDSVNLMRPSPEELSRQRHPAEELLFEIHHSLEELSHEGHTSLEDSYNLTRPSLEELLHERHPSLEELHP